MTDTSLYKDDEPRWYFRINYTLAELRRFDRDSFSEIFVPVEELSSYSLAATTPIRWDLYSGISEEDNLVSFYTYVSTLSAQDVDNIILFHVALNWEFQAYLSECFKDETDQRELAKEIHKITRFVWFTSEEVFYAFVQRACPLIYSQIDRWKLLVGLKRLI